MAWLPCPDYAKEPSSTCVSISSSFQFSHAFHGQSLRCEMQQENWHCEAFQMAGSSEQCDAVNTPHSTKLRVLIIRHLFLPRGESSFAKWWTFNLRINYVVCEHVLRAQCKCHFCWETWAYIVCCLHGGIDLYLSCWRSSHLFVTARFWLTTFHSNKVVQQKLHVSANYEHAHQCQNDIWNDSKITIAATSCQQA